MRMTIYITNPIEVHQGENPNFYMSDYPDHTEWFKVTEIEFNSEIDRKELYSFCRSLLGLKTANVTAKQEELQNERAALIAMQESLEKADV